MTLKSRNIVMNNSAQKGSLRFASVFWCSSDRLEHPHTFRTLVLTWHHHFSAWRSKRSVNTPPVALGEKTGKKKRLSLPRFGMTDFPSDFRGISKHCQTPLAPYLCCRAEKSEFITTAILFWWWGGVINHMTLFQLNIPRSHPDQIKDTSSVWSHSVIHI